MTLLEMEVQQFWRIAKERRELIALPDTTDAFREETLDELRLLADYTESDRLRRRCETGVAVIEKLLRRAA